MKKFLIILLVGLMLLGSVAFAEDNSLPSNYLVIGDKIVDLSYAMQNQDAFNAILGEFLAGGGKLDQLYAAIAGSFADVYGNAKTEAEKTQIIATCTSVVDTENPDGKPLGPQASATATVKTLSFGPSTIFTVNVSAVENLENAVGFILGEETNTSVLFGEEATYSASTSEVTLFIVDSEGTILAQGTITAEGTDVSIPLTAVDASQGDLEVISIE